MMNHPATITILKRGFIWNQRYLIYIAYNTVGYVCRREWRWYRFVWCARDAQNKELFYFHGAREFRLADGRRRKIKLRGGLLDLLWAVGNPGMKIFGDQCEDLLVDFDEPHLHWQITTSHERVVAAAKRILSGWRLGYEVDIYEPLFLEEVIGFAIYADILKGRNRSS